MLIMLSSEQNDEVSDTTAGDSSTVDGDIINFTLPDEGHCKKELND
jgi:hypothetical protein